MLADLLAHDGVEEHLELRGPVGFLAVHGGSLERDTDRIAREAADASAASLYAVLQPDDLRWHIPSARMDPADSPALSRFLGHVTVVLSIHGYGRDGLFTTLLLGGGNRTVAAQVAGHLRDALPGYRIEDDLGAIPQPLRGQHPANPVNRTAGGGVQVELPPRIRLQGPNADPAARRALVEGLVAAAAFLEAAAQGHSRLISQPPEPSGA
jgi:phage replication-related protein YjqB (UPF0714/DUF867 family)